MACILEIKVIPQSGRVAFIAEPSGRIRAYLKSPPVDGKANKELLKVLAKGLLIPVTDISIVTGLTSRIKRIRITGDLSFEEVVARLGLSVQTTFIG